MKRTFIVFTFILLLVFIVLSVLDTSEYAIEKRLWRVQKQYNKIALDPKVVPANQFDSVINQYKKLIDKYPVSSYTHKMYMQIGMTYLLKEDDVKAKQIFNEILRLYPEDKPICSVSLLNIGNLYEKEGNEKQALEIYEKIIRDYPLTNVGLNVPLYIANYYLKVNKQVKSETALNRAISFYKRVSRENPKSSVEFNALRLLVTSYYAKEEWREAVNTLGKILVEYGAMAEFMNPQRAMLIVKSINTVSLTKVKDYELPRSIYKKFKDEHPTHPFNKVLEGMVESFGKLEEKGVTLSTSKP